LNKKTVAVLFGGCSSEYSVSLLSSYAVLKNIDRQKYNIIPIGISKEGDWFVYNGDIEDIPTDRWLANSEFLCPVAVSPNRSTHGIIEYGADGVKTTYIDCALPILHGKNGEDGTVQGVFELAGIPIAGCGSLSSSLCMNKHVAQRIAETVGAIVPKAVLLTEGDGTDAAFAFAEEIGYPVFVKPVKAGSSYGVTKVDAEDALAAAIDTAFKYDDAVLVEEAIVGREISCAVMGKKELVVGEVDETEVKCGFYDFNAKYFPTSTVIHIPARLSAEERDRVKEQAKKLYKALSCDGFARVDFFYTEKGELIFGEINTIPGFTEHSHFPSMMKAAGHSFSEIIDFFIQNA